MERKERLEGGIWSGLNLGGGDMGIIKELWLFIKERRIWWFLPVILVLILLGFLIILSAIPGVAPFIYTLF